MPRVANSTVLANACASLDGQSAFRALSLPRARTRARVAPAPGSRPLLQPRAPHTAPPRKRRLGRRTTTAVAPARPYSTPSTAVRAAATVAARWLFSCLAFVTRPLALRARGVASQRSIAAADMSGKQ